MNFFNLHQNYVDDLDDMIKTGVLVSEGRSLVMIEVSYSSVRGSVMRDLDQWFSNYGTRTTK